MKSYRAAFVAFLVTAAPPLAAYELAGYQWDTNSTTFQVGLSGTSPSGYSWNNAFSTAASRWNSPSSFNFNIVQGGGDPCAVPDGTGDVNAVAFAQTKCGSSFGGSTLAVTRNWSVGGSLVQSGIIFNEADINWDVYTGPWEGSSHADFRRVAVHELGHAMGLSHESGTIMSSYAGNLESPTSDDLAGVAALYGGGSGGGDDGGGSGGGDDGGGSGGGDDGGGSGGGDDGGGSGGGTGGGSGGSGGSTPPPPPPSAAQPNRIFAGGFESHDAARGKAALAAADGTLLAYEPETRRILIHDPAAPEGLRSITVAGSGRVSLVHGDFDGDGLTDAGTFRALDGLWTIYPGNGQPFWRYRMGGPGDEAVAADYDGDGRTDLAAWSPATGEWSIKLAAADEPLTVALGGEASDVPVPADYDGDGRAEPAIWRAATGEWRIVHLGSGYGRAYHLPAEAADRLKVVPGDYDGDGRADPALFDEVTGAWTIRTSRWAETRIEQLPAAAGAKAAPSDYDGDGRTDVAWWRDGELTMALSGSGERITRSLRGVVPLSPRQSPVNTDRSAAAHQDR